MALTVDRVQAESMRVSVGDVFDVLTSYVGSTYVNQFNKYGLSLQVYAQADSKFRLQPDDLLNLYVRSSNGNMVQLATLARLAPTTAPALISLYNLYPSATLIGSPARNFSSGQVMSLMEDTARQGAAEGRRVEWTAMSYQEKITGNLLYYGFALSVAAGLSGPRRTIRKLDIAAGRAFRRSAGAARARDDADRSRDRQQSLCADRLDAADRAVGQERNPDRRGGARTRTIDDKSIIESAVEASRTRFRPILMTSFAFILGVLPLVLATGAGANARRSLGISVFTGMLASTLLAVVFVPAFFVLLQRLDERMGKKKKPAHTPPATLPSIEPTEIAPSE